MSLIVYIFTIIFVSHLLNSIHFRSWRISNESLTNFSTCKIVLFNGKIGLFPEEIVECLSLHFTQLLIV